MINLPKLTIGVLALVAAVLLTVWGQQEALGSIDDPTTYRAIVYFIATPLFALLITYVQPIYEIAESSSLVAGGILWFCVLNFAGSRLLSLRVRR